jgi:hypothetical protein
VKSGPAEEPEAQHCTPPAWISGDVFASSSHIEVCGWRVQGQPLSITMPMDLVRRLTDHIVVSLNMATPCDITGLLIGRVAGGAGVTVTVEDYEIARHIVGDGDPTLGDDERLEHMVRHWSDPRGERCVVGFFRSERHGWPAITRRDSRRAKRLFPRLQNIFLLIRSSEQGPLAGKFLLRQARSVTIEEQQADFPFSAEGIQAELAAAANAKTDQPRFELDTQDADHVESESCESEFQPEPKQAWWNNLVDLTHRTLRRQEPAESAALALHESIEAAVEQPVEAAVEQSVEESDLPQKENLWNRLGQLFARELLPIDADLDEAADSSAEPMDPANEAQQPLWSTRNETVELFAEPTHPTETGDSFMNQPEPYGSYRIEDRDIHRRRSVWRSWLAVAATWTIGVGLTIWWMDGRPLFLHRQPEAQPAHPAIVSNPLGLRVDSNGKLLEISWNGTAATATTEEAYVIIRDGAAVNPLRLSADQLRSGHIYYGPRNADLDIGLQVMAPSGETSVESVRVVGVPVPAHSR